MWFKKCKCIVLYRNKCSSHQKSCVLHTDIKNKQQWLFLYTTYIIDYDLNIVKGTVK
jgi:hypothetical protein